ncbi:MAG: hypothetical protein LBH30_05190 [Prevotellaceae bacterium]|jgi:hypothetical protein|nr:hypothetical protein [Prevotellaceae bacterium]
MYERPFGKSLCHAWSTGSIFLIGKYYLGVKPIAPGYEKYIVEPQLGGLKWMQGIVPTPNGNISLNITTREIRIETNNSGDGLLRFKSLNKPDCNNENISKISNNHYELKLYPNRAYVIKYKCIN